MAEISIPSLSDIKTAMNVTQFDEHRGIKANSTLKVCILTSVPQGGLYEVSSFEAFRSKYCPDHR